LSKLLENHPKIIKKSSKNHPKIIQIPKMTKTSDIFRPSRTGPKRPRASRTVGRWTPRRLVALPRCQPGRGPKKSRGFCWSSIKKPPVVCYVKSQVFDSWDPMVET
jgi:hypothetical protein